MSGVGKHGVRVLFVAMMVLLGALALSAAPALADEAPEVPEAVAPVSITATSAYLEGVLNPGKSETEVVEPDEYFFRYNKTSAGTGCEGGQTAVPSETLSSGAGQQHVELFVEGLEGDTGYTVCLVSRSLVEHKEATSAPVTFKTYLAPEAPETKPADPVGGITATLHGVLNPTNKGEAGAKYEFRYRQSTSECQGESATPAGTATGVTPEPVEAEVSGLAPGTIYAFCLVAENSAGEEAVVGPTVTFRTLATAPVVSGEEASEIGETTATVKAQITPNGATTSYYVEYVSEAQFQASGWSKAGRAPEVDAELPASSSPFPVVEELGGLQLGTKYLYRFVASNEEARSGVDGSEATFTTAARAAAAFVLPDDRAYELVSPPDEGELYVPPTPEFEIGYSKPFRANFQLQFKAAADGNAVAWVGEPATTGGTGEVSSGNGNEWLSTRTADGWQSNDITPIGSKEAVFQSFSNNLMSAIMKSPGSLPLSGEVARGCSALYSRGDESGALSAVFIGGNCGNPLFAGASENESQIIFQTEAALTPNAREATEFPPNEGNRHSQSPNFQECMFGCNLYDRVAGQLRLVNVLPSVNGEAGKTVPNATFGGYAGPNQLTTFSHAISNDGSRIFWTDTQAGPDMSHVYVLENGTETVPVSGSEPAEYWTATSDGHYAFYTENGTLWRFDTDTRERITIAPAAYATGTGNLVGPAAGRGTTTENSNVITGVVTSSGAFAVGQTIKGVSGGGCSVGCIPQGAKITAVGAGTLTISANAEESDTNFGIAGGSNEITSVNTAGGQFHVGASVFGFGIPESTRISSVTGNTLTLSNSITAGGTDVALEAGGPEVQGVVGVNETGEDGAYVYFVADGALAPGATPKTCVPYGSAVEPGSQRAENEQAFNEGSISEEQHQIRASEINQEETEEAHGQAPPKTGCNLYLRHGNATTLVATLAPQDNQIFIESDIGHDSGDWVANVGEHITQVTPDGRSLVFQSQRPLTGYDNVYGNYPTLEVYVYSAEDGNLACASCDPSGAPPKIAEIESQGTKHATKLPDAGAADTFSRRLISDDGSRVFFDSWQPLVSQDKNGIVDVYEWERVAAPGEADDTCTPARASAVTGGCTFLLSGGTSPAGSFLVDSDATGENVFFEHVGRLGQLEAAPEDANELYDARVNGGFPRPSQACTGTGCQGVPPAPPSFATPASATFSGAGNPPTPTPSKTVVKSLTRTQKLTLALKACKKDKKKSKRETCEKQAHARYSAKKTKKKPAKAKKASNERRAGR